MKLLIIGLMILSGLGFVFMQSQNDSKQNLVLDTPQNQTTLVVSPQTSSTSVTVKKINLPEPGFIAVRSLDNGRLGQIIEISKFLSVGEHTDVIIDLGDFYDGNTNLIVMAYQDEKSDQVFNDLDQPMLDNNKNVIAKYVKTGEMVAPEFFASTGEAKPHIMGDMKIETVRYTNNGYDPAQLEVPIGTIVQFVNESDVEMWVASNEHPEHTILPTFDQFKSSAKGTTYSYVFDKAGSWSYHDHLKPDIVGTIKVVKNS